MTDESTTATEEVLKIRKVAILIPGKTSFVKVAPKYVLPLYAAKWKGKLSDPAQVVRVIPMPVEYLDDPACLWQDVPAINAAEYEAMRLRKEFGVHSTGEPLFDVVYKESDFEAAFNKAYEDSKVALTPKRPDTHPAVAILAALPSVGPLGAKRLVESGIDSIERLANAEATEVAKIIGKNRAAKAQEAAIDALPKPEPVAE